jgi:GH24 family phage-related lysozyme (muramidase)
MKASEKLKHMLAHHEGKRNKPYLCPAQIWTIGIGSVLYQEQIRLPIARTPELLAKGAVPMIRKEFPLKQEDNRLWSDDEIYRLLDRDLATFERGVLRLCPNDLNQSRFDSLVSFSFNVGLGNLQRSTIRMKHNRGDFEGAAEAFMQWTKAGGKELPGLVKRRKDEQALYLSK